MTPETFAVTAQGNSDVGGEPTYTDTHAHFDPTEAEAVVARALHAGVTRIVAVGGNPDLNEGAITAAQAAPQQVRLALGFDRTQTALPYEAVTELEARLAPSGACAVGEAGLDYHYDAATRQGQLRLFASMLDLASRSSLPIIIHTREADEDTLAVIDEAGSRALAGSGRLGVAHCYTGGRSFARQLLDRGLYISFSGIVTFSNAAALREVAAFVPQDRLLIETDSPYLTPVPLRGQPNEPAFVKYVATCVARQRTIAVGTLAQLTTQNAENLFGQWPEPMIRPCDGK